MAYTIRKIQNKTGIVYRAIIRDRLGKQIKSKTFQRKTDAKAWSIPIAADHDAIAAYGSKGARMTFAGLVDEYIDQWQCKDIANQQQRSFYWVSLFGEYRIDEIDAE